MRDEFITEIISGLCRYYNYGIIEISNSGNLASTWALVKGGENNEKEIIVFIDEYYSSDSLGLLSSLRQELNCNNIHITNIVLVEDKSRYQNRPVDEYGTNSIGMDYKNKEIIFYGSQSEKVTYEVANIIYNNKVQENKSASHEDKPTITYIIIALNVLMFVLTVLMSNNLLEGLLSTDQNVLILLGANYNKFVLQGEYYRLLTNMFLHGGLLHIALNMYALYSIGPLVERIYGRIRYAVIYFISGIIASVFSTIFSQGVSVGASGAIFGLLGTTLVFAIKMRENIGRGFLRNIASVIIINLFIGFSLPNIDNYAHLGGLIGGTIAAILLYKIRKDK